MSTHAGTRPATATRSGPWRAAAARRERQDEARQLRALLEEVALVQSSARAEPDGGASDAEVRRLFLEMRFEQRLRSYSRRGPMLGHFFTLLSIASILAGLGASGLAAAAENSETARWIIFGLGLLVGLCTAVNQILRPAQRSVSRYRAANALRHEAWVFLNRPHADQDWPTFVKRVSSIVREAESVNELTPEAQAQPGR